MNRPSSLFLIVLIDKNRAEICHKCARRDRSMNNQEKKCIMAFKYDRNLVGFAVYDRERRMIELGQDIPDTSDCDFVRGYTLRKAVDLLLFSLHLKKERFSRLEDINVPMRLMQTSFFQKKDFPEALSVRRSISLTCLRCILKYIESENSVYTDLSFKKIILFDEPIDSKTFNGCIGRFDDISVTLYFHNDYMYLDPQSIKSLNIILDNIHPNIAIKGQTHGKCIFSHLNYCVTVTGAKKLREWLMFPLKNRKLIEERREKVDYILRNGLGDKIQNLLKKIRFFRSIEKYFKRDTMKQYFRRICEFFRCSRDIIQLFENFSEDPKLVKLLDDITTCFLSHSRQESIIAPNYDPVLERLILVNTNLPDYLDEMAKKISEQYKIDASVVYFPQMGYLIETIFKQEEMELKFVIEGNFYYKNNFMERLDLHIGDVVNKISEKEIEIAYKFKQKIDEFSREFERRVDFITNIDCLASLARFSSINTCVRPKIVDALQGSVELVGFRNLIVCDTVANPVDIVLKRKTVLTGINGGGKSTILRSIGMAVLLNQIGAFIPAKESKLTLFDAIYTKIGSTESAATSKSAFVSDLVQVGNALKYCTRGSLFLCDEFGKGTNIYDGLSLLVATINQFNEPLCVYVTHYQSFFTAKVLEYLKDVDFFHYKNHVMIPGIEDGSNMLTLLQKYGFEENFIELVTAEKSRVMMRENASKGRDDAWAVEIINEFIFQHNIHDFEGFNNV